MKERLPQQPPRESQCRARTVRLEPARKRPRVFMTRQPEQAYFSVRGRNTTRVFVDGRVETLRADPAGLEIEHRFVESHQEAPFPLKKRFLPFQKVP